MSLSAAVVVCLLAGAPVRLAVLPFDNDTNDAQFDVLRRGLADLVIADLSSATSLVLVERLRLDDVRKELKLQSSRDFDAATRVRLGKLAGATHALAGSLVETAPRLNLVVRVVELSKGTVKTTVKVTGSADDVFSMEEELAKRLRVALELEPDAAQSGHASLEALKAWASGTGLADQGQLPDAQSKLAEAVRLAPDFALARTQYAEVLKRLRAAQKTRSTSLDERARVLTEHLTAQLGKAPPARALAARMGLANLALLELQRLVGAGANQARWVPVEKRAEVERLEQLFVTHAGALIDELKAARGKNVSPQLDDADETLSKQAFDLNVGEWDFASPTSVAVALGRFVGSGWSPYPNAVDEFAIRPSAAQRSPRGLEEARRWFSVAKKELPGVSDPEARERLALQLANEHAEMLVLLGRREEAVAQWQGFLDAYPTSDDFQAISGKLEAVMLIDDDAERDERALKACEPALTEGAKTLANRMWRAKGLKGLLDVSDALRVCGKRNPAFERAAWTAPAGELLRIADCEALEAFRQRAAAAKVTVEGCK